MSRFPKCALAFAAIGLGTTAPLSTFAADAPASDTVDTGAAPVELPAVSVSAPRVANPDSVESFAMPVTALRFDPRVDAQTRNMGEAQADVSIRGGTFENTGFTLGAIPLYDPQTGHYFADLPVSPSMLGAPDVRTGAVNAQGGWNATAGNIAFGWLPIVSGGSFSLGSGGHGLFNADLSTGLVGPEKIAGRTIGFDFSASYSRDDGPLRYAGHEFQRYNGRMQLRDDTSQTDVFAGYQAKSFAWPNLYAAGNVNSAWREEREDLKTQLYAINHRQEFGGDGDGFQAGAYYRINQDHYLIPSIRQYFGCDAHHKTSVAGAAVDGRLSLIRKDSGFGTTALRYRAGVVADSIDSDTLIFGHYSSRTQFYAGLYGDHTLPLFNGAVVFTAGVTFDESNRESSAFSPVAGVVWKARDNEEGWLRRIGLDYSEATQTPTYMPLNARADSGLFRGDPDIGRSHTRNIELSADADICAWKITPAVFFRRDNEMMDWIYRPEAPNARSARALDSDTWGAELALRHSWKRLDLVLSYAWLRKNDSLRTGEASFYALNYASHRLTAAIVARLGYGVELRCDNEFRKQERNNLRSGTDTPFFTSLSLVWRVPWVPGLSLAAQVDNIWNVHYEEVPLVPGTPRTWSVRATYTW
ncbi:MAG: hypothetical protein LBV54_04910 [Puniceicoccales bacterium]|nr:hypothetical protein [Puniceicoccales bacterium]